MSVFQYKFSYYGKGSELFKIKVVNAILCIFTLGIYYPWAKARTLQYMYSQTTFQKQPFAFSGTGKEMFRGFIKLIACIIIFYALIGGLLLYVNAVLAILSAYVVMFSVIPFVIHSFLKYRLAKTKWQGINFSYRGNLGELLKIYFTGIFFTIITLGFYTPFLIMKLRRYVISQIQIGDAKMNYLGEGWEYFGVCIFGYLLTLITFGIYFFWWQKDLFAFSIRNTSITREDQIVILKTDATGADFASLLIINFLLIFFTLGLGTPWAMTRTFKFYAQHIDLFGDIDFNEIQQSHDPEFSDALGDDLSGIIDIGAVI